MNRPNFIDITDNQALIYELQEFLYFISLYDREIPMVYPDGVFGQRTTSAVTAFQAKNGIPVTGVVNYLTWTKIVQRYDDLKQEAKEHDVLTIIPRRDYEAKLGEESSTIKIIQVVLQALNIIYKFYNGVVVENGIYGKNTEAVVRSFQQYANLPETGIVDTKTWDRLALQYRRIVLREEG